MSSAERKLQSTEDLDNLERLLSGVKEMPLLENESPNTIHKNSSKQASTPLTTCRKGSTVNKSMRKKAAGEKRGNRVGSTYVIKTTFKMEKTLE